MGDRVFYSEFNEELFGMMVGVKAKELEEVYIIYNSTPVKFEEIVLNELLESNMNTGACNTALDFLIVATKRGEIKPTLKEAIKEQILSSSIYWANGEGKDPTKIHKHTINQNNLRTSI